MPKKRIRIGSGGKIRIKRSRDDDDPDDTRPGTDDEDRGRERERDDDEDDVPPGRDDRLQIPSGFVENFIETRAESQFRPDEDDVETVYALTGSSSGRIDETHSFSSEQIVRKASSNRVRYRVGSIIEHITRERETSPEVLVKFHTHPHTTTRPSELDEETWERIADDFRDEWPSVRVLYGIHTYSTEFKKPKSRASPEVRDGQIEWRSITRDHSARVFDEHADGVEVSLI
jgi:proteasome lid subunit RPN8/RPN11